MRIPVRVVSVTPDGGVGYDSGAADNVCAQSIVTPNAVITLVSRNLILDAHSGTQPYNH